MTPQALHAQVLATQSISPSEDLLSSNVDTATDITNSFHHQLVADSDSEPEPSTAPTHPDPFITQTGYEPERTLLQTYYLTALDPTLPPEPTIKLELFLENYRRDAEVRVELLTNNETGVFLSKVVRNQFGDGYGIFGVEYLN